MTLKNCVASYNKEDYFEINDMLKWRKMKKDCASIYDIRMIAPFGLEFELDPTGNLIRKKVRKVVETITIMGFDEEGIRNIKPL